MASRFTFRRLVDDDLEMMHRWLNEPGVIRWWEGDDVTMPGVIAHYSPNAPDQDGTEYWISELDGRPFGWIGCWAVADEPEETAPWKPLGVHETAGGIDYLIGDPTRRGQGLGSAMIRAFVFNVVFGRHCHWTQAAASPYTANVASCRALEKAGFRFAGSVLYPEDDVPGSDGPCSLMLMDRPVV